MILPDGLRFTLSVAEVWFDYTPGTITSHLTNMYEYHNNILSIPAKLLYKEWGEMTYDNYKAKCKRGKLVRTKNGHGAGNTAFVSFYDLPMDIQSRCIEELGDPKEVAVVNQLEEYITPDIEANRFFSQHRKPNGRPLSMEKQREKSTNCMILNAIQTVFNERGAMTKMFGRKKTKIWENMSEAVNMLNANKWLFNLPGTPRTLQRKYENYIKDGVKDYMLFIHKGEGHDNATVLKGDVADYILSQYCLPIKQSVPEVMERYNMVRESKGWRQLDEGAVKLWLNHPEQKRIWTLARHGKEVYNREFKHTLTRKKDNWFPNAYWSIDGTKLDWIHLWEDSSNKQGAKLKVDVVFDIYSEKILGSSLSFTENHTDHFNAIREAVNYAQSRPYMFTYDNQSGHKMNRMQDLYNGLVAVDGGCHFPNKAYAHNSPVEQLFNRLQQQVISNFWFSDGQSVTVKLDDNKMNTDFITDNKHLIKTVEELEAAWEAAVNIWNNKLHPKFKTQTRNEVYRHTQPKQEKLSILDIIDKLWITEAKKQITYKGHGLDMWLAGTKYQFEVYDGNGKVDLEFRRKNVGAKFIVRYDPDFMDGYIQLCEHDENGEVVFVANAEPKREHENIPSLMEEGDKEQWNEDYQVRNKELERDLKDYEALKARSGITPEREIEEQEYMIKMKRTLTKEDRSKVESEENILAQL